MSYPYSVVRSLSGLRERCVCWMRSLIASYAKCVENASGVPLALPAGLVTSVRFWFAS
jgi:hypothetical protein